jgi:XisH protein
MPVRDLYHDAVKSALIKDNWAIIADPYRIQYKDVELYADLAAERPIAVEREGQKIVVEIKSFVGRSLMTDFHLALGQYKDTRELADELADELIEQKIVESISPRHVGRLLAEADLKPHQSGYWLPPPRPRVQSQSRRHLRGLRISNYELAIERAERGEMIYGAQALQVRLA